ncbi:hypothetical protein [Nocardia brasiliensis]|uniref:hypothetical protein n=1 Tax=Nocardia brasiliensis TaxID=37326 RepID=UPI002456BE93|nr:hypothetical protein [Nocardia brasiliensis]
MAVLIEQVLWLAEKRCGDHLWCLPHSAAAHAHRRRMMLALYHRPAVRRVELALIVLLSGVVTVQATFAAHVLTGEFVVDSAWIGLALIDAGLLMMAILASVDADHAMFQPWCSTCCQRARETTR